MSVGTNAPRSTRRARKPHGPDAAQLNLFDTLTPSQRIESPRVATEPRMPHQARSPSPAHSSKPRRKSRAGRLDAPRVVSVEDMPDYPPELHQAVDRMLADLGSGHVLMTYRAIRECFGISRATVARRVKEGMVPGVRIANGRVLDEGPVRRFDRTQVHWLLLAVRFGKRSEGV